MNPEDKRIRLETAKRIAELCKEKGIKLPVAELYYTDVQGFNSKISKAENCLECGGVPAYDVAELGEILPTMIHDNLRGDCRLVVRKVPKARFFTQYENEEGQFVPRTLSSYENEADSKVRMLIYLLENDLFPTQK